MQQAITEANHERFSWTARATIVGAVINTILSVAKLGIGFLAHSQALIADGIHSLSDLLSDGLVYVAARHSRYDPDKEHPYGHGRFETAATMGLGVFLILVAGGIVWDGLERAFGAAERLTPAPMALYAAASSVLAKEGLYFYTRNIARRIKSDLLMANAWHHRTDSISSVVVFVGVGGTLLGFSYLDAVAAILVGLMIAKIGWDLGWGAMQELVDSALDEDRVQAIRDIILAVGGVRNIHMLRTRRIGGYASADVHVQVEPWLSVSEGHMIAVVVEESLKKEIEEIDDVTVHIDPEDDQAAPSCSGLPVRSTAMASLAAAWKDVPGADQRTRVVLHYLNGRIHVDAFFPLSQADSPEAADGLGRALREPLASLPEFGNLRLYFSL